MSLTPASNQCPGLAYTNRLLLDYKPSPDNLQDLLDFLAKLTTSRIPISLVLKEYIFFQLWNGQAFVITQHGGYHRCLINYIVIVRYKSLRLWCSGDHNKRGNLQNAGTKTTTGRSLKTPLSKNELISKYQ